MLTRIAVLASGGGSNLQGILDYLDSLGSGARAGVALVASDRVAAGALDRARVHGIEARALSDTERVTTLDALLAASAIDMVVLAGYLRLVPPDVTRRYRGRILNVHPALLPAFGGPGMYGARVHQAVLDSGVRLSGPTVHFVDDEYDRGPIIAQWPVAVYHDDTAESLGRRVLAAEHSLYPRVVHAVAAGAVTLDDDGRVRGAFDRAGPECHFALSIAPPLEGVESVLAHPR